MSKGFVPKSKLLKRDALTGFLFSLPSIIGMLVFFSYTVCHLYYFIVDRQHKQHEVCGN